MAADATLRWSNAVVWSGDLNSCRQGEAAATRECLIKAMQAGGASADAVTAAGQLSSAGELAFVTAWHEHDGIGVATVAYPFRANTNEGTRLVDAAGKRTGNPVRTGAGGRQYAAGQWRHPTAVPHATARLPCLRRRRADSNRLRL